MANIEDYLKWRGDLSFQKSPFNVVDNLLLAELSYVSFEGIVPGMLYKEESIALEEASRLFFKMHDEKAILKSHSLLKHIPFLMREMANTFRFKDIRLGRYVCETDANTQKQFAALCFGLPSHTTYIAYRGTDDTLIGWKEDFNMSYMCPVPSQTRALRYLEENGRTLKGKLYLGGHSKGGNLALYAAVFASLSIQKKIIHIYNNDGPGFNEQMVKNKGYLEMIKKVKAFIPEASVVGLLLEHKEGCQIVKSSQSGIMQHDPFSWEVLGTQFVLCETLTRSSHVIDQTLKAWGERLPVEKRKQFVDILYDILKEVGVKNVSDLTKAKFKKAAALLKTWGDLDEESKEMLSETFKLLSNEYYHAFRASLRYNGWKFIK